MSASLPRPSRPSRPSINPPTSALPALPNQKSRRGVGESPRLGYKSEANRSTTLLPTPTAASATSPQSSVSSPATPAAKDPPNPLAAGEHQARSAGNTHPKPDDKTIRRTVSIAAFPQPPKTASRISSLPTSSPLARPATAAQQNRRKSALRRGSSDKASPVTSDGNNRLKRVKTATASNGSLRSFTGSRTPTLLNGTGEGKSISSGPGARGSDGLLSLPSPPQSRSSSAQGSNSTSATTFDDSGDSSPQELPADRSEKDLKRGSKGKEGKGNVVVSVRVRPDIGGDNPRPEGEWMVDGRKSLVAYHGREGGDYYYDNVFTAHDKNAKVYDASAKRLVRRVMEGYHGTVFAYGMTGTGKTFSMQGTTTSPGVIPLAITDIFSYIRETPHREFLLRVSYLEIYNEKIHDLLSPSAAVDMIGNQQEEIKLREDPKRGVYASPLKEEIVQSPTQLLRVIARGDHARRTSSTQYNARSSRSHAVVQIVVESRERGVGGSGPVGNGKRSAIVPGGVRVSTLSLIDLAGSERAAENKERRQEGAHINKSLLTLGTVIARLSGESEKGSSSTNEKDGKHLPYRDSKLTRLLQGALAGNSLVSILCTIQIGSAGSVATANAHTGETLNTLKFAARAKNNIVSHAKRAEEALGGGAGDAGSRVLLERYRMEIQDLRNELDAQAKAKMEEEEKLLEKEQEQRHEEQMLEMQLARTALKERIEHLNRLILSSKSIGVNSSGSLSSLGMHGRFSGGHGHGHDGSARSSVAPSLAGGEQASLARTASMNSTSSTVPAAVTPASPQQTGEPGRDDEDSIGENGDGTATFPAQVRALQADLTDKNRYISTLEKRLLQARRSSHSRTSLILSPTHKAAATASNGGFFGNEDDGGVSVLLREKDAEIADLRARLDDKDRMVAALRSAARKRDVADLPGAKGRKGSASASNPTSPASPGENGSIEPPRRRSSANAPGKARGGNRSKGQDEMSRMLEEMILDHQDRVPGDVHVHQDDVPPPPPPPAKDRDALDQVVEEVGAEGDLKEDKEPSAPTFPLELELLKFPVPGKASPLPSPITAS